MNLKEKIKNYVPFNEQEKKDKDYFIKWMGNFKDVLTRDNEFVHYSASAFVVNKDKTKTLMVYHNIYDGWTFPGGHADGEENLLEVAIREVEEETGLKTKVLEKDIFSLQAYPIVSHIKREKFISAHTHLDVIYLLEADDNKELVYREDESQGVKWFPIEDITEKEVVYFAKPTYKKLVEKLKKR